MKKTITLLLTAALLLGLMAGCAISPNPNKDDPGAAAQTASPSPAPTESAATVHDLAAAYAAYDPDTVIARVNGLDVTWDEYFYWILSGLARVESYIGPIEDFSADFGGVSMGDYIKQVAETNFLQYRAVEYFTDQEGITLSPEGEKALAEQLEADIAQISPDGTEAGLDQYLADNFISRRTYDYVNRIAALYAEAFAEYCGESGEKITDEEALSFAGRSGLMAAKHILLKTRNDDGTYVSDAEKAEKLALAKDIIARLEQGESFDELIAQYNEDPGQAAYPDGYCFGPNEMVTEFETAVQLLEENAWTDEPVESTYGYHVIQHVPFQPDMVYTGQGVTVRQMAANEKFNQIMNGWLEQTEVEYLEDVDVGAILQ